MKISSSTGFVGRSQSGVGMIEVLIAILVFAVGVLGMISMQLAAKRSGYEATQRSIATSLSRDILERMRSNPGAVASYVYTDMALLTSAPSPNCLSPGSTCNETQLAAYDLYDWSQLLNGQNEKVTIGTSTSAAGGLVDPRACISNDSGNVTVAIVWKGVTPMAHDPNEPCGTSTGLYDEATAGDNRFRRFLTMTSFIAEF